MKLFSFCIPLLATVSFGFLSTWAQDLPPTGASSVTQVAERVPGLDPALAKNLADGAVGLAAKRLSSNPVGESGKRLLQFASALDPTNENLLYLKALIGLGRPIDPAVIPVKVTDEEYVAYLLHLGKTQNPSYFRLLLYHMVYSLNPVNRIANVKLQLARERGVVADFDGTIKRLSNTFPPPRPLPPYTTFSRPLPGALPHFPRRAVPPSPEGLAMSEKSPLQLRRISLTVGSHYWSSCFR